MLARLSALFALALLAAPPLVAQQALSLAGTWELRLDADDVGLDQGWARGDTPAWRAPLRVTVPGPWEAAPEAAGYDGVAWYRRTLPAWPTTAGERALLRFDGVNYRVDAWLDGHHLGRHDGSDERFRFDVTGRLEAGGTLVLRCVDPGAHLVDGLVLGALPHAKESWYYNYGGLTGDVVLERTGPIELRSHELASPADGIATLSVDVVNHTDAPLAATLTAAFGERRASTSVELAPGRSRVALDVGAATAGLARWSPETPALHEARLVAEADGARAEELRRVGLRHFAVDGDRFALDGVARRLRGVLYQPYFPRGLAVPPDPTFLRRDLEAIKAAGFDLVRAHLRVMPELYALCDEIGLLVHAEPTLGWITVEREETESAVARAIASLADEVRGHPSVVLVGLLNELSGRLHDDVARWHAIGHEVMPERVVLDDSGSWRGTAHYWNPGADAPVPYDDLHVYHSWPWRTKDVEHVRAIGAEHDRLVYVSEFGFGGIPSLFPAVVGFGGQLHHEDARDYARDLQRASEAVGRPPLASAVGSLDTLVTVGQQHQARAAALMTRAIRANPRVAADCYTQWRDASWENGAGLVDVWGGAKPALAAMREENARDAPPEDPFPLDATPPARTLPRVATGSVVEVDDAARAVIEPMLFAPSEAPQTAPHLAVVGRRAAPWSVEKQPTTLMLMRFVHAGGTLLMLDAPDAGQPFPHAFFGYVGRGAVADLPVSLFARPAKGHFVGKHLLFHPGSLLLRDLADPSPLFDPALADLAPHLVLDAGARSDVRAELLCLDGYGGYVGSAVQIVPYGRGHFVLSTLQLGEDVLATPSGRRMLENLVLLTAQVASRKPRPGAVAEATPDPGQAGVIAHALWQFRIYFGLAERIAVQEFNGVRPVRNELPQVATVLAQKNAALDALVAGRVGEATEWLAEIERRLLDDHWETFLRAELELCAAFEARAAELEFPHRLDIARGYARALRLMRVGEPEAALGELHAATRLVAERD